MGRGGLVRILARGGLLFLAAASVGLLVAGAATSTAVGPRLTGIGLGPESTVTSGVLDSDLPAGGASYIQLPFAESFPAAAGGRAPRVVLLSFSAAYDSRFNPERIRTERSVDGGKTFTPIAARVPISSMTQLPDGSLVAVNYRTAAPDVATNTSKASNATNATNTAAAGGGASRFRTTFWRSRDDGLTWVEGHGSISSTQAYDVVYFHRGIVAGLDGSLLATTHGYLHGEHHYRSMLARSTDGGATWRIMSTIATTPAGWRIEGRSEPTMARAAGGDLVVVMRQSAPINPRVCHGSREGAALVTSRSSDDGASWTPVRPLLAPGLDGRTVSSADPHLIAMPGGQLVLSFGRPDNKVLVSSDGTGARWTNLTVTRTGTSSGYTSLVPLTATTALQVGDEGSNWCFRADSGLHRVGIWAKTLELHSGATDLRPGTTRRIDLLGADAFDPFGV